MSHHYIYTKRFCRFFCTFLFVLFMLSGHAQRQMENLDRGLVAVKVSNGVFLSWRTLGTEWYGVAYHVYRDGIKLTDQAIEVSNYTDLSGSLSSNYAVSAVVKGTEQPKSAEVQPWAQQYKEIPLKVRNTSIYQINDATAADLDGDGQYEIIVKRVASGWNENNTNYTYFEAYKLDGTFLWEINVGPNILPDVEINIAAFDLDGDGKAEVFMRTSEGTIFGDGVEIGDTDGDGRTNYRYTVGTAANMQYMNAGPEFLSLIDGMTGAELDRVNFIPRGKSEDWGDGYGHRASKYFFGAPYLDGVKPSLFIGRGIYTKTIMRTYDVVDKKMVLRWEFNSGTSGSYFGQGNHNYTIADVDGDGRDEIVWGSMAVDDDGKGLYSTQLGHGDAMHVGDLDPFRKGIEAFRCLENYPVHGTVLHDAATGEILIHHMIDKDCGRCCAANISDDIKGKALWGGAKMFEASTKKQVGTSGGPENFRIYWDGDLLEELLDHEGFSTSTGYGTGSIRKYGKSVPLLFAHGAISNNYTKGTPSLQADLFGDWREEVIWRNTANTAIRIYTTVDPTPYRNYTLMHDHQYRQAIAWQMCGYNQPPHVSYFLGEGEGKTVPPPPSISNNRLVYTGEGSWGASSSNWVKNGSAAVFADGEHVLFDITSGNDVQIELSGTVQPSVLSINSPGNHTLLAQNGKLSGDMVLAKNGAGTFTLNGNHDYTGLTEVWGGVMNFSGELENSHVWLEFFGELNASGLLGNGLTMRYGSVLNVGLPDSINRLHIKNDFIMQESAMLVFDIELSSSTTSSDSIFVDGNLVLNEGAVLHFNILKEDGQTLQSGDYLLLAFSGDMTGDLSKVTIGGMSGIPCRLKQVDKNIYLEVRSVRSAATVLWNGDKPGAEWDLALTENFLIDAHADVFVANDQVLFTDESQSKTVNITGEVTPASITVNANADFLFKGTGKISGPASLTKSGTGLLSIENTNEFTGKVLISGGTIKMFTMPNSQSVGAIGAASSNPSLFELNGGTLRIDNENNSNRAITLGSNGGTIFNSAKLTLNEPLVGGVLTKTGSGNLILAGTNTHNKTILKEGTITLLNDNTSPGKAISLEGGTLQCSDNSGSYNTMSWNIDVPEGKTGNIRLDSRGYYTGNWLGSGILNVYIPFVRSDLNGDMSGFSGTVNFHSATGSSVELRINHSKGLPKALVVVNSNVTTSNIAGTSLVLGALAGTGELTGDETYQIGAKNVDSEFRGSIKAGSLVKTGTAELKLSGANTYGNGTTVNQGTLNINNSTGSATGTGQLTVNNNGTLTGTGIISGAVNIEKGGNLKPGATSSGGKITINNSLTLKSGSVYSLKVNPLFGLADRAIVSGKVTIAGGLVMVNVTVNQFKEGDSFKIFECNNITGDFETITPQKPGEGLAWDMSELKTKGVVKVAKATGIHAIANSAVRFYPNPVGNVLTIETNLPAAKVNVSLMDLTGKVYTCDVFVAANGIHVDTSILKKGVYFVNVQLGEKRVTQKIIKD